MVELIGVHAPDKAELVGHAVEVGKGIGKLHPAGPAPLPAARRTEQLGGAGGEGELLPGDRFGGALLPAAPHQLRLVVVEIQMRRAAGEVDDDHPLGLRREGGQADGQRISGGLRESSCRRHHRRRSGSIPSEQILKRPGAHAASHATEQVAAGGQKLLFEKWIHGAFPVGNGSLFRDVDFRDTETFRRD